MVEFFQWLFTSEAGGRLLASIASLATILGGVVAAYKIYQIIRRKRALRNLPPTDRPPLEPIPIPSPSAMAKESHMPLETEEMNFVRALARAYVFTVHRGHVGYDTEAISRNRDVIAALRGLHLKKAEKHETRILLPLPCPSINPLVHHCYNLIRDISKYLSLERPPTFPYSVKFRNDIYPEAEQLIYAISGRSQNLDFFTNELSLLVAVLDALLVHRPDEFYGSNEEKRAAEIAAAIVREKTVHDALTGLVLNTLSKVAFHEETRASEIMRICIPIPRAHPVSRIIKRLIQVHVEDVVPDELHPLVDQNFRIAIPKYLPDDVRDNGFKDIVFLEGIVEIFKELQPKGNAQQ